MQLKIKKKLIKLKKALVAIQNSTPLLKRMEFTSTNINSGI